MTTEALPLQAEAPIAASRLWVYTNFDCNLACTYCLTSSSPAAARRALPAGAFERLVDEASVGGIAELFLTGGEPFILPDVFDKLAYAASRLPTTVLTNAMLLKSRRLERLRELIGLPLTLQVSLDGHEASLHDAYRGAGSWAATVAAIDTLRAAGFRVAIGATETPVNTAHVDDLRSFVHSLGIGDGDFFLRPLTKRGFSEEGIELRAEDVMPELTVTAEGVFWHPQSAGAAMLLSHQIFPLHGAIELMRTTLEAMRADGAVARNYRCA